MKLQATSPLRPTTPRFGTQLSYSLANLSSPQIIINRNNAQLLNLTPNDQGQVGALEFIVTVLNKIKESGKKLPGQNTDRVILQVSPVEATKLQLKAGLEHGHHKMEGPALELATDYSSPKEMGNLSQDLLQWFDKLTNQSEVFFNS